MKKRKWIDENGDVIVDGSIKIGCGMWREEKIHYFGPVAYRGEHSSNRF